METHDQQVMFSHKKDNWQTPKELFDQLDREFRFTLDGAADETNHLCTRWLGPGGLHEDALNVCWQGETVFCNPPYSMVKEFVKQASNQAGFMGAKTVMLVPSRTDTKWFHQYVYNVITNSVCPGVELRFIKGRLKFGGGDTNNSAPFPSMLIIWR
jgi:site-specific DNA-methyltransferase (adenine-specific)